MVDKTKTTNAQIKSAVRGLWLRSKERNNRLKIDSYTCQDCGKKQSVAAGRRVSVQVHHIIEIEWKRVIQYIRKNVLVDPDKLKTLCKECHGKYRIIPIKRGTRRVAIKK